MDGGDRGGIEFGDRPAEAAEAAFPIVGGQLVEQWVVAGLGPPVGEMIGRLDQPVPHFGAELVGGRPGEGDHEELRGRYIALGDVPRGQGGQGEGLAGPGTGLNGELPPGELAEVVEGGFGRRGHGHTAGPSGLADASPPEDAWPLGTGLDDVDLSIV